MVIRSIHDPAQVFEVAEEIKNRAQASGRFIVVQNSLAFTQPQAHGHHRPRPGGGLGVPVSEIGTTLGLLVGGGSVSQFDRESNSYDVITAGAARVARQPRQLGDVLRAHRDRRDGAASSVVNIATNASPAAIEQFNQLNSATISALPLPGVSTGDGLA